MLSLRHPFILILISIIPMCILGWLFYGTYQLVEIHLPLVYRVRWKIEGVVLTLLWSLHVLHTITLLVKGKKPGWAYAGSTLVTYMLFLVLYFTGSPKLLPYYLPGWITYQNLILYAGCFIMPTIIHALYILTIHTKIVCHAQPRRELTAAILIVVLWIIQYTILHPHVMIAVVLYTINAIGLMYLVMRIGYILYRQYRSYFRHFKLIIKASLIIAFPLTALLLNNDLFFSLIMGKHLDVGFFVLTMLNGVGLCLPDVSHRYYRLILFMVRSTTSVYIFFLFLMFVPALPLSALTMINLGLGVMIISPVIILIFYTRVVQRDFRFLYQHFSYRTVHSLFLSSVALMPVLFHFAGGPVLRFA